MEKKELILGFKELRQRLHATLKQVAKGNEAIITIYGKPIAKIVKYQTTKKGK